MTIQEAAALTGKRPESLTRACRRGTLKAVKRGHHWFVHKDDLQEYLDNPPKPGPRPGEG